MSFYAQVGGTYLFAGLTVAQIASVLTASIASLTRRELVGFGGSRVLRSHVPAISHRIGERSTADFSVKDIGALMRFEKGEEVQIWDEDGYLIFGGVVDTCAQQQIGNRTALIHELEVADYHYLSDKRLFVGAYEAATSAGDIVRDVLKILKQEGVSEGLIMEGEVLERQAFPHMSCTDALQKLSELSGYIWFISEDKKLYFCSRSAWPSAWDILDGTECARDSIRVSHGNPEYRNVQYMMGGSALTDEMTETFKGNGAQRSFTVGYPLAMEPVVKVNNTPMDVGIKGVESSKDWYWNKGDPTVTQDPAGTPLAGTDTLTVVYFGQYKLIAKVSQYSEITNRRLVEGFGSGKVERVASDSTLADQDAATEAAKAKLLHYAVIGRTLEYDTRRPGLAAGVLQTVTLPIFGITDGDFLITATDISYDGAGILYHITAVEGPVDVSWEQMFCDLAQLRREGEAAAETDTVQGLDEFTKVWAANEHPNPFIKVLPGDSTFPGNTDLPSLAEGDELKYVVLYTNGAEFFRKAITTQTRESNLITSICIIMAQEANDVPISHAGLWGGDTCSSVPGSGVEMSKFAYSKLKNSMESLQLNFYDQKGW